jgi:tetratricopeptide (TPR) repeat protein
VGRLLYNVLADNVLVMPNAFVAMPIKEAGSQDFLHFKALYDDVIRPALAAAGYQSIRADEVQKTGAVTSDIVRRLAEVDLVLADLSDLNPNVFYELGIRHALRGSGTIMMLDQARTHGLPFDVMPYRAILYTSDLPGIAKLRAELQTLAASLAVRSVEHRDSPVHDAVSVLPVDVPSSAAGKVDRAISDELAALRARVRDYENRFGLTPADGQPGRSSPLEIVMEALGKAERGELTTDLIKQAEAAVRDRDTRTFLERVRKLLAQTGFGLSSATDYSRLAQGARTLGITEVANAIFEAGVEARPHDETLRAMHLGELAHSLDPQARERARAELLTACGLTFSTEGDVEISDEFDERRRSRVGVMLDAYHADRLHDEALRITSCLVDHFPDCSALVRNHARALREVGAPPAEIVTWYRRAILCPDADDTSAAWFGTYMFNMQRYVDAMEAYLLALRLDPDDIRAFSDLLHSAANARRRHLIGDPSQRRLLPSGIDTTFFESALLGAFSCPVVTQREHDELLKHAQSAEIAPATIDAALAQLKGSKPSVGFKERYDFACRYYDVCRSSLTQQDERDHVKGHDNQTDDQSRRLLANEVSGRVTEQA